eukprot:3933627-Rhodomonas_salina.1
MVRSAERAGSVCHAESSDGASHAGPLPILRDDKVEFFVANAVFNPGLACQAQCRGPERTVQAICNVDCTRGYPVRVMRTCFARVLVYMVLVPPWSTRRAHRAHVSRALLTPPTGRTALLAPIGPPCEHVEASWTALQSELLPSNDPH